jgi:multiple sugar transport system ATP-binding protein
MDEPLSNLDAKLRVSTRTQIAALQRRLGVTTVYVTHDQVEAMTMGDRVAVMKDGVLQQVDSPLALYDRPGNLFVAGFIGSPGMNLLAGKSAGDGVAVVDGIEIPIDRTAAAASSGSVTLGIRPEAWRIAGAGASGFPVTVAVVEELGADAYVYATPAGVDAGEHVGEVLPQVVARLEGRQDLRAGEQISLIADPRAIHVFDTGTGARLALAGTPA